MGWLDWLWPWRRGAQVAPGDDPASGRQSATGKVNLVFCSDVSLTLSGRIKGTMTLTAEPGTSDGVIADRFRQLNPNLAMRDDAERGVVLAMFLGDALAHLLASGQGAPANVGEILGLVHRTLGPMFENVSLPDTPREQRPLVFVAIKTADKLLETLRDGHAHDRVVGMGPPEGPLGIMVRARRIRWPDDHRTLRGALLPESEGILRGFHQRGQPMLGLLGLHVCLCDAMPDAVERLGTTEESPEETWAREGRVQGVPHERGRARGVSLGVWLTFVPTPDPQMRSQLPAGLRVPCFPRELLDDGQDQAVRSLVTAPFGPVQGVLADPLADDGVNTEDFTDMALRRLNADFVDGAQLGHEDPQVRARAALFLEIGRFLTREVIEEWALHAAELMAVALLKGEIRHDSARIGDLRPPVRLYDIAVPGDLDTVGSAVRRDVVTRLEAEWETGDGTGVDRSTLVVGGVWFAQKEPDGRLALQAFFHLLPQVNAARFGEVPPGLRVLVLNPQVVGEDYITSLATR